MPRQLPRANASVGRALPFLCDLTSAGPSAASVKVAGELDLATTPELKRALREAERLAPVVVLDLRDLAFMDSSGLHAILDASKRARQAGRRLAVLRGPANVDRVFELTHTHDHIEIHDTDPLEPPMQVLPQLVRQDSAS